MAGGVVAHAAHYLCDMKKIMLMETAIKQVSVTRCGSDVMVFGSLKVLLLLVLLLMAVAGAVYFGVVLVKPLGFYLSVGLGALIVDPLRNRMFSRGDSSRRG